MKQNTLLKSLVEARQNTMNCERSNIKVIFFDIDGTLFSHTTRSVPASTLRALKCLQEKGILCVIATGRHISEMREMDFLKYGFDAYITLNGQICLDSDLETVFEIPMEGESMKGLLDIFHGMEIPTILTAKDGMYVNFINEDVYLAHQEIHTSIPEVGTYSGENVYMGVIYCTKELEEAVAKKLPGCSITRWCGYGIDVLPGEGDKVAGIRKYLELQGISREETIAFGDGENDMEMLRYAGIGIALGNAEEEVKAAADYVTADIDDDGVSKALEYFHII